MLKVREERRKVLVRARLQAGAGWVDVCIVNISSRGIGVQAPVAPVRGTIVEVRRGPHSIVGQVMWAKGHRFGVAARGTLPIYSIINEPDRSDAPPPERGELVERRRHRRTDAKSESNRLRGRAFEFVAVAAGATCLVLSVGAMMHDVFAKPIAVVSAALVRK